MKSSWKYRERRRRNRLVKPQLSFVPIAVFIDQELILKADSIWGRSGDWTRVLWCRVPPCGQTREFSQSTAMTWGLGTGAAPGQAYPTSPPVGSGPHQAHPTGSPRFLGLRLMAGILTLDKAQESHHLLCVPGFLRLPHT